MRICCAASLWFPYVNSFPSNFVSKSVMTGFVNALAILIFLAQVPELIGVTWLTYVMVAAGLGIIYGFPYLTKAVPSPSIPRPGWPA